MHNQIEILKSKELLTAEEAKLVFKADLKWASEYLFHNFWGSGRHLCSWIVHGNHGHHHCECCYPYPGPRVSRQPSRH